MMLFLFNAPPPLLLLLIRRRLFVWSISSTKFISWTLHMKFLRRGRGVATAARRMLIFDYGGTLLHKVSSLTLLESLCPCIFLFNNLILSTRQEKFDVYIKQSLSAISGRRPTDTMMEAIRLLSNDPQNIVVWYPWDVWHCAQKLSLTY